MASDQTSREGLRVAIEGCGHGTLHAIYASVQKASEQKGWDNVDLLIIGGDFQSVRNSDDLTVVSMPAKYRELGDFHEYYSGTRTAPCLTIFVGGNHEASNYLWELYYGGWVAPNIYYLGAANVLRLGPLRIAGMSGIWKGYNYKKQHHERLPYNQDDIKSIYHVREVDARKLMQIRTQVDVGLSHDWPRGIEWHGDWRTLFRKKNHFESDARDGSLGSVAARLVMDRLRPPYWFSAHLHIKFSAVVGWDPPKASIHTSDPATPVESPAALPPSDEKKNEDEIDLDLDDDDENAAESSKHQATEPASRMNGLSNATADDESNTGSTIPDDIRAQLPASFAKPAATKVDHTPEKLPPPAGITNNRTRFLALDKCLPNRDFLQLQEIVPLDGKTPAGPIRLEYDREWLAITRVFASELELGNVASRVPSPQGEAEYRSRIEQEEIWVEDNIVKAGKMVVPDNFVVTAPVQDSNYLPTGQPREYSNPQTQTFCDLVGISNAFHASEDEINARLLAGPRADESGNFGGNSRSHGFRGGGRSGGRGRGSGRGGRGGHGRGRGRGRGW